MEPMQLIQPINLSFENNQNNELIDIKVHEIGHRGFLVRDSKTTIQFKCHPHELNYDIDKHESFFDDLFFQKISNQEQFDDDDVMQRNDPYYRTRLNSEVVRIVSHLKYAYKEFGAVKEDE